MEPNETSLEGVKDSEVLGNLKAWAGEKASSALNVAWKTIDLAEKWIDKAGEVIQNTPEFVKDLATETIPDAVWTWFNTLVNIGKWIKQWTFKDFSLLGNEKMFDVSTQQVFTKEEEDLWNKLNTMHWLDMTADILWFWYNLGKEAIFWTELSKNLKNWIDENDFFSNVWMFNKAISETEQKLLDIQNDSKYENLFAFNQNVVNAYLKANNKTEIEDVQDFINFRNNAISQLNWIQQKNLLEQLNQYAQETSTLQSDIQKNQQWLSSYISENVEWWEEVYNKFTEDKQKADSQNEYIWIIWQIYSGQTERVNEDVQALGIEKISDYAGFDNLKNAIIDDATADKQYEISLLWMKDLPWHKELAQKMREVNQVTYSFNIDFMKNYVAEKNLPENKTLDEVDLRNKVLNKTWSTLNEQQKDLFRQKEAIITSIAQYKESQQFTDRMTKWDFTDRLKWVLDLWSFAWVTIQKVIDQAFSFEQEVPHYVKQETRNLVMSDEWMGKKFLSVLTYNPDAIISTVWLVSALWLPTKWLNAWMNAAQKGLMKLPWLKVWFGASTVQFVGKWAQALSAGQIYWAGTDAIIDSFMVEAPTNTLESFNQLTSLLFDVTPLALWQTKNIWAQLWETTINSLAYKYFIDKESKDVITDFASALSSKTWTQVSGGQAKTILDNLVKPIYSSIYNPKEIETMFKTKWEIYKFVSENITKMDEIGLKEVLTNKWLWLYRWFSKSTWLNEESILDIQQAFNKTISTEWVQKQFADTHYNKVLDTYKWVLDPKQWIAWVQIDSKYITNPDYINTRKEVNETIELMKVERNKDKFDSLFKKMNSLIQDAQIKYSSNVKFKQYVDVTDLVTGNVERLYFDELNDLEWKDFLDLVKNWQVQVKKWDTLGKFSVINDKTENTKYDFSSHLKMSQPAIDEFVNKYSGLFNNISDTEIKKQIKNLLFWKEWKRVDVTITSWFTWKSLEEIQPVLADFTVLATKVIWEFLWRDNKWFDIMKQEPIFINEVLKYNMRDSSMMVSWEDIATYMSNDNSYFNISYWMYYNKNKELQHWIYLYVWKKVQFNDIIKNAANWVNEKWLVVVDKLLNEHNQIKRIILSEWFEDWKFNIEKWLQKLNIVYSAWRLEVDNLFTDNKIDKSKLTTYLKTQTKITDPLVHEFVYDLFKDAGDGYKIILEPIINSIAYHYVSNRTLINELIKRLWKEEFDEIFSSLLLSPKLTDDIAQILLTSSKTNPAYKKVSDELIETIDNSWKKYQGNLEITKANLIEQNARLNKWLTDNNKVFSANETASESEKLKLIERKNILQQEIDKNNNTIKSIDAELKRKVNPNGWAQLTSYMVDLLKWKAKSFVKLTNVIDTELKNQINNLENSILWLEKVWDINKNLIKELPKLSDEDNKTVKEFLSKVKSFVSDEELLSSIKIVENEKLKKIMMDIRELSITRFQNKNIVYKEDLIDELDFAKNDVFKLDYNEAIKENPIAKYLNWFINRNSIAQDDLFTKNILDYFSKKDWEDFSTLDSIELYNQSKSFKEFIDSLIPLETKTWNWYEYLRYNVNWKEVDYNTMQSNYESVIKSITNSIQIDTDKWIVNEELIKQIIEDPAVKNRFIAISTTKDYWNEIEKSLWVKTSKRRIYDYKSLKPAVASKPYNELVESKYQEQILQIDKMIEGKMDIWIMKKANFWNFGYVKWFDEVKFARNINSTIESVNKNIELEISNIVLWRQIKDLTFDEKRQVLALQTKINRRPWEALDRFSKIFNEDKKYSYFTNSWKEEELNNKELLRTAWLLQMFDEWYYFAGSFWDKASLYQLYRAPRELIAHFKITDRKDINKLSSLLYKPHYAYSNGYIKVDTEIPTFDDFKKEILKLKSISELETFINKTDSFFLDNKTIKKREAFNMSNFSIAKNDTRPIQGYVVDVQVKNTKTLFGKNQNEIEEMSDLEFTNFLNDIIVQGWEYSNIVADIKNSTTDIAKQKVWFSEVFLKDLTDGTAWSSKDIWANLLANLWFWSIKHVTDNILNKGLIREIKSHVFWDIDIDTKKVRYGWKHLVNIPEKIVDDKWNELSMTYITGIESAKLKQPVKKPTDKDPKTLTIDWIEYKIIWVIDGMDMSFYKNAASTLLEEHTDMTIWAAIQSVLSNWWVKKTEDLQKSQIDIAYQKLLSKVANPNLQLDAYSELDKAINKIVNQYSVWIWSSSVLWNKITWFLQEVKNIIDKSKDEWQSMFIRQSSLDIQPNEVIMSDKAPLVNQIRNETSWKIFNLEYSKLEPEQKIEVDNNLYTVWYRFPVPSKYNIGAYRILIWEKLSLEKPKVFWEFWNMWAKQVVTHPISTYLKLQWDNDGDHIFFISMLGKWWNVIAKDILWHQNEKDLFNDIVSGNFVIKNEFIITDQVKKDAAVKEKVSLLDLRVAALDGKSRIGNVSASWRTIKILSQMLEDSSVNENVLKTKLIKTIANINWEKENVETTFWDVIQELTNLKTDKAFFSYYDSLLQLTIDFWGWDKTKFDELWFMELMWKVLSEDLTPERIANIKTYSQDLMDWKIPTVELTEEDLIYWIKMFSDMDYFITPMSTWYSKANPQVYNIGSIIKEQTQLTDRKVSIEKLYPSIWSKRTIYEYMINSYWKLVDSLNKTDDFDFMLNNILTYQSGLMKKYKKELDKYSDYSYISKNSKAKILDDYNDDLVTYSSKIEWEELEIFNIFNDSIDTIKLAADAWDKLAQAQIRKDLFIKDNIDLLDKYPDTKSAIILKAYLSWENKVLNYLTNEEKVQFLLKTDESLREKIVWLYEDEKTAKLISEAWLDISVDYTLKSKQKYADVLNNAINNLKQTIDEFKIETPDDVNVLWTMESDVLKLQSELDLLKSKTVEDVIESVETVPTIENADITYSLPTIKQDIVDLDYKSSQQLLFDSWATLTKSDNIINLKSSSLLMKYTPDLLAIDSIVRDTLNIDKRISDASAMHIYHFADYGFLSNKDWVSYILKNNNVPDYENVWRKIQYEMINYEDWVYRPTSIQETLNRIRRYLAFPEWEKVMQDEKFVQALTKYSEEVIQPVTDWLNRLEFSTWYKIYDKYKWEKRYSLITDVLEAHKSDSQLALKIYWINSQVEFERLLKDRWVTMTGSIRTMTNALFKPQQSALDKVIGYLKATHYTMTYWLWSTLLTQNWMFAWISQLFPNYAEVRKIYNKNISSMWEAYNLMEEFSLLNAESVKMFSTWLSTELKDQNYVDTMFTKLMQTVWINNPKWNDVSSLVHLFMTNPLAAWDLPVEQVRKLVAINQAMTEYWIKSSADFRRKVALHWNKFLGNFRTRVNINFAESGGWVVSSSRIYRDTVFSQLDNYFDNFVMRLFTQTMWYLMGWSYHKMATLLEKEWALFTWMKDLLRWDYKSAKLHLDDWFSYHNILFKQFTYATWLYLKMQKYEKDNNDRVTLEEFQKAFNNSIVSFEILFWRYIEWLEAANAQDATLWEQASYTTFNMLKNALRLWKQWEFVTTMYNHYQMQWVEWKASIMESFQYATEQHYTWYMKFQWLKAMWDAYNTLIAQWTTWYLMVWGLTPEEELFNTLLSGKIFKSYNDSWFVGSLLNYLNIFKNTEWSAWFNITWEMAEKFKEVLTADPKVRNLISGWQLWTGDENYDLSILLWSNWDEISEIQAENIQTLFRKINNYVYGIDPISWVVEDKYHSKHQALLTNSITQALKQEWFTMEQLVELKDKSPKDFLDKIATLETKYWISHPLVISHYLTELKDSMSSARYKQTKTKLNALDYAEIEREVMLANQDILNLNWDFIFSVIDRHAQTYYSDVFAEYEKKFKDAWFAATSAVDYVNKAYLIWQVIWKDTSVAKLNSRYAVALQWIDSSEEWIALVNGFLSEMQQLPYLSQKEKLANTAAAILWLNKATLWVISDNEKFNQLTTDAKKLLANWMYKAWRESIQFDSGVYLNEINKAANWTPFGNAYNKMIYPKFKSESFGWARPNYSKQFQPIRDMMPKMIPYIEKDYNKYLADSNPNRKQIFVNPLKFPIMQEYTKLVVQKTFQWYESKWVIRNKAQRVVEQNEKKTIRLKTPKKMKTQKQRPSARKIPKKVRKWLNPNLELWTQINQ